MQLPAKLFTSTIKEREIYFFSSEQLNTSEPHFFVCIKRTEDEVLVFTCCTSQFESRKKFIESRKLPTETLVYIKAKDEGNPFNRETYVDCNNYQKYRVNEFATMIQTNRALYKGEISATYYEQIIIGLLASPLIDEDLKDLLPNPDDISI